MPLHSHSLPTRRSSDLLKIDRIHEEAAGSFGTRIASLEADVVIDLICFTPESAQHLVDALTGRDVLLLHCGTIWVHGHSTIVDRKSTRLNSSHLVISYAAPLPLSPYTTLFRSTEDRPDSRGGRRLVRDAHRLTRSGCRHRPYLLHARKRAASCGRAHRARRAVIALRNDLGSRPQHDRSDSGVAAPQPIRRLRDKKGSDRGVAAECHA